MILLDIETLPPPETPEVQAAVADRLDRKLTDEREIEGNRQNVYDRLSVTPIWARILCVAWTHGSEVRSVGWTEDDVADLRRGETNTYDIVERRVLTALFASASEQDPGRWGSYGLFDMHVLRAACLRHGWTTALQKVPGGPCDKWGRSWLDFSDGWSKGRDQTPRLSDVLAQMGLSKTEGMHGSEVYAAFQRGEVERIRRYCEGDVEGLRAVALALGAVSGEVGEPKYIVNVRKQAARIRELEARIAELERGRAA